MHTFKSVLSGTIWGITSKVIAAFTNFITIPLLVGLYTKADYGLITLAFSLNAYLRIMDMGMNIGSVRFFSKWIGQGEWMKVEKASQSSIVFYGAIGLLNALVFVLLAEYSNYFFRLSTEQISIFRTMMYILSASTFFNWVSNVINHLLSAYGAVAWMNKVTSVSSMLNFIVAIVTVFQKISLEYYFLFYTITAMVVIPLNVLKLSSLYNGSLKNILFPKWHWESYNEIVKYSIAIFTMGIFQFSADNLRPLFLEYYSNEGIGSLTDYRVIQTVSSLVMTFGGVFLQVLLPSVSNLNFELDKKKIEEIVYSGTRYISAFIVFFIFVISVSSQEILYIYMGKEYVWLSFWLVLWLVSLLGMHNSPVASLVLSTGRIRPLVYMSAISCIVSLPITALLAGKYNVGAAVIGYLIYVIMQSLFYYFYYTPKVLKLNSARIFFRSFLPSLLIGVITWAIIGLIPFGFRAFAPLILLMIKSVLFTILYSLLILVFVIRPGELVYLLKKTIKK